MASPSPPFAFAVGGSVFDSPVALLAAAGLSPVSVGASEGVVGSSAFSVCDDSAGVVISSCWTPLGAGVRLAYAWRRDRRGGAWTVVLGGLTV